MSLIVVSLTTVLVMLRPPTKDEMQWESAKYNAKGTAAEGSEKASEAWETTKGKAREAAEGSEKAAEACETTKDKVR